MVVCPRVFPLAISALVLASCSSINGRLRRTPTPCCASWVELSGPRRLGVRRPDADASCDFTSGPPVGNELHAYTTQVLCCGAGRGQRAARCIFTAGRRVGASHLRSRYRRFAGKSGRRRGTGARDARTPPARGARAVSSPKTTETYSRRNSSPSDEQGARRRSG